MKYRVTVDGTERMVEILSGARVRIDGGEPMALDVERRDGVFVFRDAQQVQTVAMSGEDGDLTAVVGGRYISVQVETDRPHSRGRASSAPPQGTKEVRAPMAGRIVKLLTRVGAVVDVGAPLIVVEAMKMENELRAMQAGTIASIEVLEGQTVENRAVLLRFL